MQHNYMEWNFVKVYLVLYNLVIGNFSIVFNSELQVKSERKPISVWSTYSPSSFTSQDT